MHSFKERLFVCGFDERPNYHSRKISHFVGIANPSAAPSRPSWFKGAHLQLVFGDVVSEADARLLKTTAPSIGDIQRAFQYFRGAWSVPKSRILVSCDYGASRSPALAYGFIADQLGAGKEAEAFKLLLDIRPDAVPNGFVVRLADTYLSRNGALVVPLKELYDKINAELFPKQR